jgi:nucleoside 2-deoxyribosyltransferase
MRSVYLAGPIMGCDKAEANDWRQDMISWLHPHGIIGVSPLRCEPLVGERYSVGYTDPKFGVPNAIRAKNIFDVKHTDLTLAYFPIGDYRRIPSVGTIWELGVAQGNGKPVIVVCRDVRLLKHPVIETADWLLPTLDDAADLIIGILEVYCHGH